MKKLLIADQGETACRIIRTAQRMGIATVAVQIDDSIHARLADTVIRADLTADAVLAAAQECGADAIHPGAGPFATDADFAGKVRAAGLIFVGPSVEAIRAMRLKDTAKTRMKAVGIPVAPGYHGEDQGLARLERMAELVGYPLVVKAVAGVDDSSQGVRAVHHKGEFAEAMLAAKREAQTAFGNDGVMLEKLIARSRHIEVQIFGDGHGNMLHLFEREVSVRHHHAKLVTETPAPGLSERLRHILGIAAVTAGMAVEYSNAGTVEFVLDTEDLDEEGDPHFYFQEMRTRLQMDHAVTEAVTGLDLVEWQLRVARGEMLPLMQDAVECHGVAIMAQLRADISGGAGVLQAFELPDDVRVEHGLAAGDRVEGPLAGLVSHAATREEAIDNLVQALDATIAEGVPTNRGFLARLVNRPAFRTSDLHAGLTESEVETLLAPVADADWPVAVAASLLARRSAPATDCRGFTRPFRLNLPYVQHGALYTQDGRAYRTAVAEDGSVRINGGDALNPDLRYSGDSAWMATIDGEERRLAILERPDALEIRRGGASWRFLPRNPLWGPA
ncbi:MAG: biotin carboxylase N-terminal domain-containing protein [Sphingomonadaceae bacterium]